MLAHIGFAKCASTALQLALADHKDLLFLGCNPKTDPAHYYHNEIGLFFENEFRFGPDDLFDKAAQSVRAIMSDMNEKYGGRVALSYENISMHTCVQDIPTDIKFKRLAQVLPNNSNILVIHRPVPDFLLSLYKHYLMFGYTGSLDEFLEEHTVMGEFGLLGDLDLARMYERLRGLFDENKIHILPLSDLSGIKRVFETIDVSNPSLKIANESLPDDKISAAIAYNRSMPNRKKLLDWLELHRSYGDRPKPDDERFYLARYRHAFVDAVKNSQSHSFDKQTFVWPDSVVKLEARNHAFLRETLEIT